MGRIATETIKGAKWGLIQKFTLQPVQFLFGIVLARLITPEEFGILGLTSIFFAIAGQLQECGFGAALIRKQDRTEADCSTMFWYNIAASFVLSASLFLAAPWFAEFFHQPALVNITRVSAGMMFLGSTTSVHRALFSAERDFRTLALIGMVTTLAGLPVCLYLAYTGWSYWSMVIQGIVSNILSLILIWTISPWKPRLLWSNKSFKEFFGFGFKLVLSGLSNIAYFQSRQFIIGKFYSPAALGNFNKGFQLIDLPQGIMNSIVGNIIYPILVTVQNDEDKLVYVYRRYIRLNNLLAQFMLLTMTCNAQSLIIFLYGPSWEEAYIYAQLLSIGAAMTALSAVSSNIFMVKGRTDIVLKISVYLRIVSVAALLVSAQFSIIAMCYAAIFASVTWLLLVLYYTTKISKLDYKTQLTDYIPYVCYALIANIPSIYISYTDYSCFVKLLIGGGSAFTIYSCILRLRRDQEAAELLKYALKTEIGSKIKSWFSSSSCS